jgi:hypothetical protein
MSDPSIRETSETPPKDRPKPDRLELDYARTTETIRMLTEIRFKLLAAVPAASVAIIALVAEKPNQSVALVVGLFGLSVTFGLSLYELRNTQIYNGAIESAKFLEGELSRRRTNSWARTFCRRKGRAPVPTPEPGGVFSNRPKGDLTFFGVEVWHRQGLAIIYATAVAGWIFLIGHSALALVELATNRVADFGVCDLLAFCALPLFKLKGLFSLLLALIGFVLFRREFLSLLDKTKTAAEASAASKSNALGAGQTN